MAILVLAEQDDTGLKDSFFRVISALEELVSKGAGEVHVLCVGESAVAEAAAKTDGVDKVYHCGAAVLKYQLAEKISSVVVSLANDYEYIVAAATANGKNIMPRVAALLDVMIISDVIAFSESDTFIRPIYAGNALQTVQTSESKKVMTVRTAAFSPAAERSASVSIHEIQFTEDDTTVLSEWVSDETASSGRQELTSAKIVISGGRGVGSKDNFSLIERVASQCGAAVGASRAAVDCGYAANDMQVGQTGKVVAPELYIAVGVSGAIQHLAGMKDSKVIVAINNDPDAPIFQIADIGLVADLMIALPELEAAL
jgi:electron transfer flavoprotein alpha subunit